MSQHSKPRHPVPADATDCHMHVFGDLEASPPAAKRSYTPAPASLEDYLAMCAVVGLHRNVFVTASAYGSDNRCMLDAMRIRGGLARGVAVIDETTTDAALSDMADLGVKGVRVNAATFGITDIAVIAEELNHTFARVAPLGMHVQLFAPLPMIDALADTIANARVPVVIDHMGLPSAKLDLDQPGFETVCRLLQHGHVWVKVSGTYRVSASETDFSDATPFARTLVECAPKRCVWGSDWPHTGHHKQGFQFGPPVIEYRKVDDGTLMDLLAEATTPESFRRVLVDNPAELYGF
eukprot:gene2027-2065_t